VVSAMSRMVSFLAAQGNRGRAPIIASHSAMRIPLITVSASSCYK